MCISIIKVPQVIDVQVSASVIFFLNCDMNDTSRVAKHEAAASKIAASEKTCAKEEIYK